MKYYIWSEEHGAWWGPNRAGYTRSLINAGIYEMEDVKEILDNANGHLNSGDSFNEIAFLYVYPIKK